jgi:hypothetical protein
MSVKTWMAGPGPAKTLKKRQFPPSKFTGQPWDTPGHDGEKATVPAIKFNRTAMALCRP